MAAYLRTIADALADGLSQSSELSGVTVNRENWVEVSPEDLASPLVVVVPGGVEVTKISRQNSQLDITCNIFVGRRVSTDSQVESITDLADTVLALIRRHEWDNLLSWPEGSSSPSQISVDTNPDDGLNERNVWRAFIVATYRVFASDSSA